MSSKRSIDADFRVCMSFNEANVAGILEQYEADHATRMDITAIATEIIA